MQTMSKSKRGGLLAVAVLALATLCGQLVAASIRERPAVGGLEPPPLHVAETGGVRLEARLDRTAVLAGGDGVVRMELVVAAPERAALAGTARQTATDLTVILDRSGSMGGSKMEFAKAAVLELLSGLGPEDRFALVSYESSAYVEVRLAHATPAARAGWREVIDAITPGGGTNMSAGMDLALDALGAESSGGRTSRFILISDGEANQGDSTPEGLAQRARRVASAESVLSSVGVGDGFNESLMTSLADAGTGNFYYLADSKRLAEVFRAEFEATRETVATGVVVTLEPPAGVSVVDAAGYPLERTGSAVAFRPGSLFSGQERRIWVTYQVVSVEPGEFPLGGVALGWSEAGERRETRLPDAPVIACVRDEARYIAGIDKKAWGDAVVNESYNQLQQKVAESVKRGDRDEALRAIGDYKDKTERLNSSVQSPAVSANLNGLGALEAEVDDAFTGEQQAQKQNSLSKEKAASGWDGRRAGSKRK